MPEAVIVSTARSPIGRAMKGSLVNVRPDDLTAHIVNACLEKVPALDHSDSSLMPRSRCSRQCTPCVAPFQGFTTSSNEATT